MINHHSSHTLSYEGSIPFDVSPITVWQYLTDPSVSAKITPNVIAWHEVTPLELFHVDVGIKMGNHAFTVPVEIKWSDMVIAEAMRLYATTEWERCQFEIEGNFLLAAHRSDGCILTFSSVVHLSNAAVRPLAHTIFQRSLRQFFVNLKAEVTQETMDVTPC